MAVCKEEGWWGMSKEEIKLILEALEGADWYINQLEMIVYSADDAGTHENRLKVQQAITVMRLEIDAQNMASKPTQQEPVVWKLVPKEPTHEMLKAMDECSTEGYDERLYAGHASSVYMAAVDAAPTPSAQRTWVGLTNKDVYECEPKNDWYDSVEFARAIEAKLREKNT